MIDDIIGSVGLNLGKKAVIGKAAFWGTAICAGNPIGGLIAGGVTALVLYGGDPFRAALGMTGASHAFDAAAGVIDAVDVANIASTTLDAVGTVADVLPHAMAAGDIVTTLADHAATGHDIAGAVTDTAADGFTAVPETLLAQAPNAAGAAADTMFYGPPPLAGVVPDPTFAHVPSLEERFSAKMAEGTFVAGDGPVAWGRDVWGNDLARDPYGNGPVDAHGNDTRNNIAGWHGRTYRPG